MADTITRVPDTLVTEVYVAKVRFQETGEQGTVKLRFDRLRDGMMPALHRWLHETGRSVPRHGCPAEQSISGFSELMLMTRNIAGKTLRSSAERTRAYRRRRRLRLRSVRIQLSEAEIGALVRLGYLGTPDDMRVIGYAATAFISDALSGT